MKNDEMGKKLHKAEQSEIDFVKSQGGSPNYNDVEKHISDIAEIFDTSEDEFSEEDLRDSLEDDFEDKVYEATNVIDDMNEDINMKIETIKSMIGHEGFDKKAVIKSLNDIIDYVDDICENTESKFHDLMY